MGSGMSKEQVDRLRSGRPATLAQDEPRESEVPRYKGPFTMLSVRIPGELARRVKMEAATKDTTVQALVERYIAEGLQG